MQVLLGMGWFGTLLGLLLVALIGYLIKIITIRLFIITLVITGIYILTGSFLELIDYLVAQIAVSVPTEVYEAAALVLPSNTVICIAAVLTAQTARWVYIWAVKVLQWKIF